MLIKINTKNNFVMIMVNEKIKRMLIEFNPFWKAHVKIEYKERDIYKDIWLLINEPQIISFCGLRRVGKTTIMKKIIHDLVKQYSSDDVLYFSFDDFQETELLNIIDIFEEIHNKRPKFLFFDEVQKLSNWAEKIKVLYDTGKYKIFVSGSESLFLLKGTRESLVGRIYEFEIKGLTFSEYLKFVGKDEMSIKPQLYEKELHIELEKYLLIGGFPELIGKENKALIKHYIRTTIIEKIVFMDMTKIYSIDNPAKLISILEILIFNPGMIVEFTSFSQELGISRQTISKYFEYLELAHLVIKLYNFSKNRSTSEKCLKKYYPSFLSIALIDEMDDTYKGKLIETFSIITTNAKYFWRNVFKDEVDIVFHKNEKLIPIEIKYRNEPRQNEGLEKFCKKYNCKEAILVTKDIRKNTSEFANVQWIPAYEFLLKFSNRISTNAQKP